MKTLSIIAVALVSGAAYGDEWLDHYLQEGREQLQQMQAQEEAQRVHEQLEEIQAQQRQIRAELFDRQLEEMNRAQKESFLRSYLEDCE